MTNTEYQNRLRKSRRNKGLCPRCGGVRDSTFTKCFKCRQYHTELKRKNRREGKCGECSNLVPPGAYRCDDCRMRMSTSDKQRRHEALMAYGGKCMCPGGCLEDNLDFLTFDHVNNDGMTHRKRIGATRMPGWLKKNGYPDTIRVLCYNCNCARVHGPCPHETMNKSM